MKPFIVIFTKWNVRAANQGSHVYFKVVKNSSMTCMIHAFCVGWKVKLVNCIWYACKKHKTWYWLLKSIHHMNFSLMRHSGFSNTNNFHNSHKRYRRGIYAPLGRPTAQCELVRYFSVLLVSVRGSLISTVICSRIPLMEMTVIKVADEVWM